MKFRPLVTLHTYRYYFRAILENNDYSNKNEISFFLFQITNVYICYNLELDKFEKKKKIIIIQIKVKFVQIHA